jgi:hypothetical protein
VPVTQLVEAWSAQTGYTDDAHKYLATIAFRLMQQGMNSGPAFQQAIEQTYGNMKGFDKWGAPAISSITSAAGAAAISSDTQRQLQQVIEEGGAVPEQYGGGEFVPTPGAPPNSHYSLDVGGYVSNTTGKLVQPGPESAKPTLQFSRFGAGA